jgi:hypothetical protein
MFGYFHQLKEHFAIQVEATFFAMVNRKARGNNSSPITNDMVARKVIEVGFNSSRKIEILKN